MTAFAASFVPARIVTAAAEGDDLAMDLLMGDVRQAEMTEGWSDAKLAHHIVEMQESYRYFADERDWNEAESSLQGIYEAESHQEHRKDLALQAEAELRYLNRDKGLVWNPFQELLKLHGMAA